VFKNGYIENKLLNT